jgi:hypothetical protein
METVMKVALTFAALMPLFAFSGDFVPNGEADRSQEVRRAIDAVRAAGGGEIRFAKGEYHFRTSVPMDFYVSNHDNPRPRGVFLPVTNVSNIVLSGDGAKFIFHGEGIAIALVDTLGAKVKGIGVDWASPYYTETRFLRFDDGRPVFKANQKDFVLAVENGDICSHSEGWRRKPRLAGVFANSTRQFVGFVWFSGKASDLGGGVFRLEDDWRKAHFLRPLEKDDVILLRDPYRPNPALFAYRAHDTLLEDMIVHSSAGMGFIAQRCRNVTVRGSGKAADATAGSMARKGTGRFTSSQADATHFSNCRGLVTVENCLFEGMCDDAINVHSTCLMIEKSEPDGRIVCRYKHKQSVGFEVFLPGERLRCIKGRTLENSDATVEVVSVKMLGEDLVELGLGSPLPADFGVGDAVENADWQPAVRFTGNIVRLSVPRATLFTTPGKVVCSGNLFDNVSGQAIHMSADAWDWYESGACSDISICSNVFRNCMLNSGRGVIQITPNVKEPWNQRKRYHRNILIEGNVFDQHKSPLLYARSVSNLVWRANKVLQKGGYDLSYAEDVKIED